MQCTFDLAFQHNQDYRGLLGYSLKLHNGGLRALWTQLQRQVRGSGI